MPYVLPQPEAKRKWYNDVGEAQGITARLLLAMLSGGASGVPSLGKQPTQPTAGNPGQIQFPSGVKTQTSPLEVAIMNQMGGAPSQQGGTVPVTYQPPTKWGFGPSVDRQSTQADITLKQNQAEYWKTLSGMTPGATVSSPSPSPSPTPSSLPTPKITSPILQKLWQGAQSGNTAYMDAIRNLYLEKGDPEAYLILQSFGEVK